MVCWYKVSQRSHAGKHQGCAEILLFIQPTNSLGVYASSAVLLSGSCSFLLVLFFFLLFLFVLLPKRRVSGSQKLSKSKPPAAQIDTDPHQPHTHSVLDVTDTCLRFRPIISAHSTKTSSPVWSNVEVQLPRKAYCSQSKSTWLILTLCKL